MKAKCSIEGCDNPFLARGWCSKHWSRWRRNGHPLGGGTPKDGTVARFFCEVVVPCKSDDCLIWPFGRDQYGYGKIGSGSGSGLVHRRACEEVHGQPPDEPDIQAAHNCGNGHLGCCNPRHLRWATRVDNSMDRVEHGTHNRGEKHKMAKLTEGQVLEIRRLEGEISRAEIARKFDVSAWNVACIHRRKSWFWLADDGTRLDAANDNEPERAAA